MDLYIYERINAIGGIFARKCSVRESTGNNDTLFTYDSETTLCLPVSSDAHHSSRFLAESPRVICLERMSSNDCAMILNIKYMPYRDDE